ncbi:MAG: hypothetical protein KAU50_09120, partial [Candidatus Marinimicrobia bacterium]|nr:hypothetical protein [Candidatus Neomarinimicrobiota bacterium]
SFGGFVFVNSDQRKVFSINLSTFTFGQKEADIRYVGFNPGFTWRPTDYFSLTASSQIRIIHDTWMPWIDYESSEDQQTGDERFIVATLDQTTVGTTLRFDLTLTPDLTIQFYGSPYLDAGIFSEDKLVVAPKAGAFTERYHTFTAEERDWDGNPNTYDYDVDGGHDGVINFEVPEDRDFNYKQFNANLVLRWEYQTGSAVYLVWSNNLSHSVDVGDFDFARDMKQLLKSSGENVFMIKASYLLNI